MQHEHLLKQQSGGGLERDRERSAVITSQLARGKQGQWIKQSINKIYDEGKFIGFRNLFSIEGMEWEEWLAKLSVYKYLQLKGLQPYSLFEKPDFETLARDT